MKFYILHSFNEEFPGAFDNLSQQYRQKWCDAEAVNRVNGDCERCPVCGKPVSMLKWLGPRKIRLIGKHYPDKLGMWIMEPLVVSQRVVVAYQEEGLTGIKEFSPIEVTQYTGMKRGVTPPPQYYYGEVPFDLSIKVDIAGTVVKGQPKDGGCPLCNPWKSTIDSIEKLSIDSQGWSGADIMRMYSYGVIVSQRFYDFVHAHGFTNFIFTSVDEVSGRT